MCFYRQLKHTNRVSRGIYLWLNFHLGLSWHATSVKVLTIVAFATKSAAADLEKVMGQSTEPTESRSDVSAHVFWKRGTTTMIYIRIVNLYSSSYLHMMPEKALEKAEKYNKDKYFQACLKITHTLTIMLYSA